MVSAGFATFLKELTVHDRQASVLREALGAYRFDRQERSLRLVFPAIAIALGLVQGWGGRHLMNPDGISYLDIADAYARRDWSAALNAYWSPLYTWILAAGLGVVQPSPEWEFTTVHFINFCIYVFAVGCFHFLLLNLIAYDRQLRIDDEGENTPVIPETVWWSVGYTIFALFSLQWIGLEVVSPDMTAAAIIFFTMGILVRLLSGSHRLTISFALGICLGLCYLSKVATAIPVIACSFAAIASARRTRVLSRITTVVVGLVLTAGPFVTALSLRKGTFTLGDSGKLNYAWFVNAVPRHWVGELPGFGTPLHPHQQIFNFPAAYAYDPSAPGTYPGWFDPSRWFAGLRSQLNVSRQLYAIKGSAVLFFEWAFDGVQVALIVGMVALYLVFWTEPIPLRPLLKRWFLFAPAFLALAMYGLVWLETRYLAAVMTLLWLGVLSGLPLGADIRLQRVLRCITTAIVVVTWSSVGGMVVIRAYEIGREAPRDWLVAEFLRRSGLQPGDTVAVIGHVNQCGWARLARVKITAEIPPESQDDFATANEALKSEALQALFASGVKAVVADHRIETGCMSGWRAAAGTEFHVCQSTNPQ
jgi:hypothetical protein